MNQTFVSDIGMAATAVGVFLVWRQLLQSARQARTEFEDSLTGDYRNIIASLGAKIMIPASPDEPKLTDCDLDPFYRYFDLCNEQISLRAEARVSRATWTSWRSGMQENMKLPGFRIAWSTVSDRIERLDADIFNEFRAVSSQFTKPERALEYPPGPEFDPADWRPRGLNRIRKLLGRPVP